VALAAWPSAALAGTLSGKSESGGKGVSAFVSVTGANAQEAVTSDSSGSFSVNVPDGTYEVAANAPGYAVAENTVDVSGSTQTKLDMTASGTNFSALPAFGAETGPVLADGKPCVFYVWDFAIPQMFRTVDCGGHWTPATVGYDDSANGLPKDFAPGHAATDAVMATSGFPGEVAIELPESLSSMAVYYSTDFGVTFSRISNVPTSDASGTAIYWGHAGSTDVMVARVGNDDYVADMSSASPAFSKMSTPYTTASTDRMVVADGADAPWVAVAHGSGSVDVYRLVSGPDRPAATSTTSGFPSNPAQIGFGGSSSAGHPPSALLVSGGSSVAMATKANGEDSYGSLASATQTSGQQCVEDRGTDPTSRDVGLAVAPDSGGSQATGFSLRCFVRKSGSNLTLTQNDQLFLLNSFGYFAFDAAYDGSTDPVILVHEGLHGVAKSAAMSAGVPDFPVGQDASAGTGSGSGGSAVNGITAPITDGTAFGPAGPSQVATAVDPGGGSVSLASDDGGATNKVALKQGSQAVDWWQGASGSWLVFSHGQCFGCGLDPNAPEVAAFQNWTSSTPSLESANLQGTSPVAMGNLSLVALAGVPGADEFFVGESPGYNPGAGQVRRISITPGNPPSAATNVQIAGSQVTTGVADLAYCPAAGSADSIKDALFIAEGSSYISGNRTDGALLKVDDATGPSPSAHQVGSIKSPASVNVVRAHCGSGTVYVGLGGGNGPSQQPGQVFKSTDGGQTFSDLALPACAVDCPGNAQPLVTALAVNPNDPSEVLVAIGSAGLVIHSTDGGKTWTTENDPASSTSRSRPRNLRPPRPFSTRRR
jgi:hypothetical protein